MFTLAIKKSQRPLLKRFWTKLVNFVFEFKFGIQTRGCMAVVHPDAAYYATINYSEIKAILNTLNLRSSDVFIDIGCGKGRVICYTSRFNIKNIIGVDIDNTLCRIAHKNASRVHGKKTVISVINDSAENFDYSAGTVFYLYNPFGALTLMNVLKRIRLSIQEYPRSIRIVYVNPVHDSLLQNSQWLKLENRWNATKYKRTQNEVSFWRSTEPALLVTS